MHSKYRRAKISKPIEFEKNKTNDSHDYHHVSASTTQIIEFDLILEYLRDRYLFLLQQLQNKNMF